MTEAHYLGMLVIALSSLIGLFAMVYKPLSENTKAMTTLGLKLEYLTEKLDGEHRQHEKHIQDFEEYKEKVRESNQKQWNKIEEHENKLTKHEEQIKHMKGGIE